MGGEGGHQDHQGGGVTPSRGPGEDGHPEVRPVHEVLLAMGRLGRRCATATADGTAAELFDEALSLMLELRVPRMPDTDAELEAMIDEGSNGPWLTSEEVFAGLRESADRFAAFLARYRGHVAAGRWEDAARALMPAPRGDGVTWEGGPYDLDVTDHGAAVVNAATGETAAGTGDGRGTAALSAVMAAHAAWPKAWRR